MVDKTVKIESVFEKTVGAEDEEIYISGYASTTAVDRAGDTIPTSVWEEGIRNFLKNPVVLAFHDHTKPVGRVIDSRVDKDKGLWVKARISKAAGEVYNLIKDGVITAFSVSIRVLDAEYNALADIFVIKKVELLELSTVSVPCNQDTLFSLAKSFKSEDEYKLFKMQFASGSTDTKESLPTNDANSLTKKEFKMDEREVQALLAAAVEKAAKEAAEKALAERDAAEKAAKEEAAKAAQQEEAIAKQVAAAIALVKPTETGAEKLLAEVTKRFEDESKKSSELLAGLEATLKEKSEELLAMQKSKMSFTDNKSEVKYEDKEKAVLLAAITGKSIENTKFGKQLLEKAGAHQASATWELEVSTNMEAEVRRRLVVAPIIRSISMKTNVMTMPVNPEAGYGTWITNAQFGTTNSPGASQTHQLKEITLNAYKIATMEYLAYEEEEDSLIVLTPIIRDAMVRRLAKGVDKAFLLGAGSGGDPVKGLSIYDATSVVTPTNTGAASVANMRSLRKDLGAWGLEPGEVTFIVSTDIYYDLLDDTTFQTMDKVGSAATLLTGQVGMIGNSPVLVSGEFPTKAGGAATASTNIGAIAVAAGNFLVGNQRGLRFDTQDLVETQRKVLVSSLRTGMTQVTTNMGQGVSTLRWS